ncbi:MAG: helix-turn-helix domain-containing protein [Actinobacteria bacterium]|nr:helix-turn-helix domain-containing protein [Actinomycetota bacterium]
MDKKSAMLPRQSNLCHMTTIELVSSRLRAIRLSRGLTLHEIEVASKRRIRAVVLGSYERGDRALSVRMAIVIAQFYEVPLSYLLEEPENRAGKGVTATLDLRRIRTIFADSTMPVKITASLRSVFNFTAEIVKLRNDWNGELISLRSSDIDLLAAAIGVPLDELIEILRSHKLLLEAK